MALCQSQFEKFHEKIKLREENDTLKEKREIIINKIRKNLSEEDYKPFTIFNQGSYAMHTGVVPLDDDYDIDVGLYFDMSSTDYEPLEVKKWINKALSGHTNDIKFKNPCVTVTYKAGYHVDITAYAASNFDSRVYLAKGKPSNKSQDNFWEESNPKDLIREIRDHLDDKDDRRQFRRVVRYLKRWKDENFTVGNGKPNGIALTSCSYHWLSIKKDVDAFTNNKKYRDLDALIFLVREMISKFIDEWVEVDGQFKYMPRLKVYLPVEPKPELFSKMSYKQMENFKNKLENLLTAMENARDAVDPVDAAEILKKYFGSDFPIPPKPSTGKKSVDTAVIPSSESAKE